MKGAPRTFWGKLERDVATKQVVAWHPLVEHCAHVAAVCAALLELPTWRHDRRAARGYRLVSAPRAESLATRAPATRMNEIHRALDAATGGRGL